MVYKRAYGREFYRNDLKKFISILLRFDKCWQILIKITKYYKEKKFYLKQYTKKNRIWQIMQFITNIYILNLFSITHLS